MTPAPAYGARPGPWCPPRPMVPAPAHDARKGRHYYTTASLAKVFVYSSDAPCGRHGPGRLSCGGALIMCRGSYHASTQFKQIASPLPLCYTWPRSEMEEGSFFHDT